MKLRAIALSTLFVSALGCGETDPKTPDNNVQINNQQNNQQNNVVVGPGGDEDVKALIQELSQFDNLTADEFLEMYDQKLGTGVTYTPGNASNLDLIQGSSVALSGPELDALDQDGFVISGATEFPSFVYAYETIYMQDLPVYISADSILNSVHRSYDEILKRIEVSDLIPELTTLLESLRTQLASGEADLFGPDVVADVDFYLAVALTLLTDQPAGAVAGADDAMIDQWVQDAIAANGAGSATLFGRERNVDYSQFKPRGHYTDSEELERYFRAMMWLGRIDLRILEPNMQNELEFNRDQLEMAFALSVLFGDTEHAQWEKIHDTIGSFVGEPDNMILTELDALLEDLGVSNLRELQNKSDDEIVDAIQEGGYGTQRISSHIMINGIAGSTKPLSSTFMIFGQRYVLDSHVFSNVVFDRVQHGNVKRMMPDPLDAAFAALGNDHAGVLLADQLREFQYAPDLQKMRVLADRHGDEYWDKNLYNLWMSSLRKLSPKTDDGLPEVAKTEAWNRRMLNTQMASWAELRHDTILYAKQSYTGGVTCEFPDAYVDPYPEFYDAIANYAKHGQRMITELGYQVEGVDAYFENLYSVSNILSDMAEYQRTGTPYNDEMMAFVNQAVRIHWGCGDPENAEGWYPELFLTTRLGLDFDPTIADVHTQPTDEAGAPVGKVLHVGTGSPRLLVTTVDTCEGPRAYAGVVSSYFEVVTENFERLDDIAWSQDLQQNGAPIEVDWMSDLVVR